MQQFLRSLAAAAALAGLAGCAGLGDFPDRARYAEFAGEPVEDFRYVRLLEWQPLDENAVLLRFERNRYYALSLREPCIAHPREADRLALAPAFPGRLRVGDRVALDGDRCIIGGIRPLDYPAWRESGPAGDGGRPVDQSDGGT